MRKAITYTLIWFLGGFLVWTLQLTAASESLEEGDIGRYQLDYGRYSIVDKDDKVPQEDIRTVFRINTQTGETWMLSDTFKNLEYNKVWVSLD